jgi:hypothetical protein
MLILLCDNRPVLGELSETFQCVLSQGNETFDAARGSPGVVAFGTRSVVKLDGLDWLAGWVGLVRRGVDGRDCNACVCVYVVESGRTEQQCTATEQGVRATTFSLCFNRCTCLPARSPPSLCPWTCLVELAPDCC